MLNDKDRAAAANALLAAQLERKDTTHPGKLWPDMTIDDAYAIQRLLIEARLDRGARIVGHKIGLTSRAIQKSWKVNEPNCGVMLDDAVIRDGAAIPATRFLRPRLEVELAFVMGADLEGPGCEVHDVLRATEYVTPALEIIDYHTEAPRQLTDTIADNAAFGAIVLGGLPVRPDAVDLRRVAGTLAQNGAIEETGVSAGVMGHPAASVAWLVRKLHAAGDGLRQGQMVLAGSFTRPVDVAPGDVFTADYGPLGAINISFTEDPA